MLRYGLCLLAVSMLCHQSVAVNSLDTLISNDDLKFVFIGGKGGVGKTTSSSAIAAQLSLSLTKAGKSRRVLLISTDPAHSLSDAFRMKFSNKPTAILPDLPNLEVMEVNPTETMRAELEGWTDLAKELGYNPDVKADDGGESGIGEKIHGFQQWLSGVPGIDEATALSSAIEHIESGRYDLIVFDTAPTGHTLKLLELPTILQVGLDKLESWQATLWGYWEMIRGIAGGSGAESGLKDKVGAKLRNYKASIGRVSNMITDKTRTRFVVVCIAEYLSISESRRLLSELDRFDVLASHIVVNQLVMDYLEPEELTDLEQYVNNKLEFDEGPMLAKALASAKLTSARRAIQSKYLNDLKICPEVNRQPNKDEPQRTNSKAGTDPLIVLEVPLLPSEVTGPKAILGFSQHLIGKVMSDKNRKAVGVKGEREVKVPKKVYEQPLASADEKKKKASSEDAMKELQKKASSMIADVEKDPELAQMIASNPKLADIMVEVKENPMSGLKYMMDPDVSPFLQKAMQKLGLGGGLPGMGGPRGAGGRRKRKSKQGAAAGGVDLGGLDMNKLMGQLGQMGAEL